MRKPPLPQEELENILELLKTKTFSEVGYIYGATNRQQAYQSVRLLLKRNKIDMRQFVKKGAFRPGNSKLNSNSWMIGGVVRLEDEKTPKIIKTYKWQGYMVKVYETRYAMGI